MLLERAKIYGVDGVGKENPSLVRTDCAVGLSWFCGNDGEIYSDFDRCFPWCDMMEVEDENRNVFIRIPKFYSKITKNADGTYKYQISGTRYEGFLTLFLDGQGNELDYVLVGKYEAGILGGKLVSRKGQAVNTEKSLDGSGSFRNYIPTGGYQLYDVWIDAMIKHLFLIEFATTDSQSVMRGAVDLTDCLVTGHTDHVKTPSGSYNEIEGFGDVKSGMCACKYRGIENPWGNTWTLVDGIRFNGKMVFVCYDPSFYHKLEYPDGNYHQYVGDRSMRTEGVVRVVEPFSRIPALAFVSNSDAAASYYSDMYCAGEGSCVLAIGGWAGSGEAAGLWCCHSSFDGTTTDGYRGVRLCLKG